MGEAAALGAAVLWALTANMLTSQTRTIRAIPLSALRLLFGSIVFVALLVPSGALSELQDMSAKTALSMVASGALGLGVGDTLYIASLGLLGAARTFPISGASYPLLTFVLAASFLDEEVTVIMVLGALLIVAGLCLLVMDTGSSPQVSVRVGTAAQGVVLAIAAAGFWALATTWLKLGSGDLGAIAAGSLRVPAAALCMTAIAASGPARFHVRNYGSRSLAIVGAAGLLGSGVAASLFIFSVQEAGAGKAAILSSTAPLFALPLSVLLLSERLTPRIVMGTIVSILGIWLVV
jgi:drug/metabolite transporter (DMT)-like permease